MRSFLWIAKARVAPGSHDSAKRDDQWRPERDSKRVGCAESRMNRPPPHVHGKEGSTVRVRQRASRSRCKRAVSMLVPLLDLATKVAPGRTRRPHCRDPLFSDEDVAADVPNDWHVGRQAGRVTGTARVA